MIILASLSLSNPIFAKDTEPETPPKEPSAQVRPTQALSASSKPQREPNQSEESSMEVNCEELQDQFDFYRRLAMQDKEALKKDLKNKNNQKNHQQKAIKLQLKEMDDAQKKARQIHQKLEEHCGN